MRSEIQRKELLEITEHHPNTERRIEKERSTVATQSKAHTPAHANMHHQMHSAISISPVECPRLDVWRGICHSTTRRRLTASTARLSMFSKRAPSMES